jgi:[glutamine synthetase] adenylyltransferase / [glutamine synthetase]-adenylyl-L-tyrosine phosphorylase
VTGDSAQHPALARADHSRFVQRVRRRLEARMADLPAGVPDAAGIGACIEHLRNQGQALPAALRIARQLVLERLAVLDVEQDAPLSAVTGAMTTLAEVTLELALAEARRETDQRHGAPRTPEGAPIDFWIVGMGKLGARELNVSSS